MYIDNFEVEINRKNIKNINLKVYPDLSIKASVPYDIDIKTLERMIILKKDWINKQLKKYEKQNRITKRNYISGEDHYLNGKRYILRVYDSKTPSVKVENAKTLGMYVTKTSSVENKEKLMTSFYKNELAKKLDIFIPKWESQIGVKLENYNIRKMKNKWGSCDSLRKEINFNVDLAKKKDMEIQYVVVHELLHLIEHKHNENFRNLINIYCPKWEAYHESLNEVLNPNKEYC